MKEFKGTRGEVISSPTQVKRIDGTPLYYNIKIKNQNFISTHRNEYLGIDEIQDEANANLIVDAFKVRQQINCELSELLEQRNEMLAMLEELYEDVECWSDISSYGYGNKIEQLIKKVKDNG
jgi:hypothetical protein